MKMKKYLLFLALTAPMLATAGIIAPDGNEWELRGSYTDIATHTSEAAADTGWTWATSDQWSASGLSGVLLTSQVEIDAFEGVCNGSETFCQGYLSNNFGPDLQAAVICIICDEQFTLGTDRYALQLAGSLGFQPRLSFTSPSTSVPEPTSLALIGLGLLGMRLARRRVEH